MFSTALDFDVPTCLPSVLILFLPEGKILRHRHGKPSPESQGSLALWLRPASQSLESWILASSQLACGLLRNTPETSLFLLPGVSNPLGLLREENSLL